MTELPIHAILADVRATLAQSRRLVLQAPPGAGKTTGVPLALLNEPWLAGKSILMLEPRRLAARAAAARMAQALGEAVGERVGFRVRFESRVSPRTRIEVVTEGILTRRLQQDPELAGVGLVIFDEFHERHLHSDLALALCLDSANGLRDDLALLVMSATLDGGPVARLLGDAPLLTSAGRAHPVDIRYLPRDPAGRIAEIAATAVRRAVVEAQGDILVFLPGAGEIRWLESGLRDLVEAGLLIYPLYGDLALEQQQRAITPDPQGRRKLVLATNIAETSLTIEGVSVVVDSGWMRAPRFDPRTGLTRLETGRVSRAAADQRAGRAGRLGPGVCYRLWSAATQTQLAAFNPPEIQSADLAPLALDLAQWGVADAATLAWLDPPPAGALAQARQLLQELGALDAGGRLSPLGRKMAALPLHPRLAHMLVRAKPRGVGGLACDIAALLSERDILRGPTDSQACDFTTRLSALQVHRRAAGARVDLDRNACVSAERAARQWRQLLGVAATDSYDAGAVGGLLALAYPDRVARRRNGDEARYLLANGRGARLDPQCPLAREGFIVAADVDGAGDDSRIRRAAALDPRQLEDWLPERFVWEAAVRWAPDEEAVVARRVRRFGALELAIEALPQPAPEALAAAMQEGVRTLGLDALPWTAAALQLRARVQSLRDWFPDEDWPDFSPAGLMQDLSHWLGPYLVGITRRSHLARLDPEAMLHAALGWTRRQRLDQYAPESITVPSGSRKRVFYEAGQPPVLAVKLQELFGLADTPRIANGRIPVLLHLLSPAQRPIQVTQDLRGFWERTYLEVKKELKGRYPKHPWPDDPWTAIPTARAKPRAG
ncbi:MAG: ATP-dependent helicase HrpB [Thiotrichales bacterium]